MCLEISGGFSINKNNFIAKLFIRAVVIINYVYIQR